MASIEQGKRAPIGDSSFRLSVCHKFDPEYYFSSLEKKKKQGLYHTLWYIRQWGRVLIWVAFRARRTPKCIRWAISDFQANARNQKKPKSYWAQFIHKLAILLVWSTQLPKWILKFDRWESPFTISASGLLVQLAIQCWFYIRLLLVHY